MFRVKWELPGSMDAFWKNQIRGYIHTGSWNLVCRNGWLGLQVLFLHLNVANVKKKKNEIFNIQKIQVSGFSWKKKKIYLKVWHGCIYYCTSTNQPALCKSCPLWRWHVLSNSQPFPWPLRSSKPWGHMTDASLPCIICPCWYLEFVPLELDESIARSFCLSLGLSDLFVF